MGRVLDVASVELPSGAPERTERRARIQVIEAFRGTAEREMDVFTGVIGNTCAYDFQVGQTYLIYAFAAGSRLSTSVCSRTRLVREAAEDLAYLRTYAARPSALGTIQGRALRWEQTIDSEIPTEVPLEGAVVVASSNERRYEASTARDGTYRIRVPAGRYRMDVKVPDGWYVPMSEYGEFVDVLDTRGCAEAEFPVMADGRIAGRVVDARGDPVAGMTVSVGRLEDWSKLPNRRDSVVTGEQGLYELNQLPPGRYLIGIGDDPAVSAIFHPGTTETARATRVELESSERLMMTDLVLPASARTVQVSGTVRAQSGQPIAGAKVYVHEDRNHRIAGGPAVSDSNGRFLLSIFTGQYRITAEVRDARTMRIRQQQLDPFDASGTLAPFVITLPD